MLANLVGFLGDFDLAEEAVQEAFAIAAERWAVERLAVGKTVWAELTPSPAP